MKTRGIYAGTFDPLTRGHTSVIWRAAQLFQTVVVMVAENVDKKPLFQVSDRVRFIEQFIGTTSFKNIEIRSTDGYVSDFCDPSQDVLVRGIRTASDLNYEQKIANFNRARGVETVFLPAEDMLESVSSSKLKELVRTGDTVAALMSTTPYVYNALYFKKCKFGVRLSETTCHPMSGCDLHKMDHA